MTDPTDRRIAERRKIVRRRKLALAEAIRVNDARPVGREASRSSSIDRRRPDSDRRKAPQCDCSPFGHEPTCPTNRGTVTIVDVPATAPTPVQPAGARQWMDERFKGHMDGDYRTFDFDDETVVQLLDEYRAASVPVRPHMVAVPLKLIEDLKEFLNRRMERDRWLNEQSKLRDGLDDCLDPLRERPMDFCAMCAGTGKRFENDIYIGLCKCVRPAREHYDSYVANRTAPAREGK